MTKRPIAGDKERDKYRPDRDPIILPEQLDDITEERPNGSLGVLGELVDYKYSPIDKGGKDK